MSALRGLQMEAPDTAWSPLPPPPRLSVLLASLAVVVHLTVSSNLLLMLHINYNTDGGNPLIKFHPATYIAAAALMVRLFTSGHPGRRLQQLILRFRRTAFFMAMMIVCMVLMIVNVGFSGVAVYIESYFSAGVLLLVLADASEEDRRLLGQVMLGLFVLSAIIGVGETIVHRTLEPIYLGSEVYVAVDYEFRGQGLYSHALTGSMMTQIGVLLLAQMRLPPGRTILLGVPLMLGLVSFGGRTALLTTMFAIVAIGGYYLVRGVLDRTVRPGVLVGAIIAVVVAAVLMWVVVTETSVGVRLAGKLTLDDNSSQTRNYQWMMLGVMSVNELLFGMPPTRIDDYIYQLGLVYDFHIVENFWLIAFMGLGAIGFVVYLLGFFSFLLDLWRFAPLFGRAILVTTVIVASTSNSLGSKSNVLFVMTAAIVAATGFAASQTARSRGGRQSLAWEQPNAPGLGTGGGVPATADFDPPRRETLQASRRGGLPREPTAPDRALRPLRFAITRTPSG